MNEDLECDRRVIADGGRMRYLRRLKYLLEFMGRFFVETFRVLKER